MSLLAPLEARRRILAAAPCFTGLEEIALGACLGRTLAEAVSALRTQPPFDASAMDGYAVRASDIAIGKSLCLVGQSAAGHPFAGTLSSGQAVRIFTGAVVPEGADTILIQENAVVLGADRIAPTESVVAGRFIRKAGLDFRSGESLLSVGTVLDGRHLGLAASMGHTALAVRKRPRVALLSTGDELVLPGHETRAGQIISSNAVALAALVTEAGGEAIDLGIVGDNLAATTEAIARACAVADIILTTGGASVGDHDMIQPGLEASGFSIDFWKVAVRPGKPLMLGVQGGKLCIGLPGNPVSSYVCGLLFVDPLIRHMLGQPGAANDRREPARLAAALPANDMREEYMRAFLMRSASGHWLATPFPSQDSSIQRLLGSADALLVRPAHAPAAKAGDDCDIIRL